MKEDWQGPKSLSLLLNLHKLCNIPTTIQINNKKPTYLYLLYFTVNVATLSTTICCPRPSHVSARVSRFDGRVLAQLHR